MSNTHQTQQEKIERYLRNKMSEEEKVAFQFELLQNKTLRAELDDFRTMQKGTQAAAMKQQKTTPYYTKYITGIVILLLTTLIVMFYFDQNVEQKTVDLQSFPVFKSDIPIGISNADTIAIKKKPIKKDAPTVAPASSSKVIPPSTIQSAPPAKKTPISQPIATNFQPNPILENLIGSQVRGSDLDFVFDVPTTISPSTPFPLRVTLTTTEEPTDYLFRWLLFSNQAADYQNFRPLKEVPLDFTRADEDYVFTQELSFNLSSGLYYYFIEDIDSGDIFGVRKLEIR